uniref:Uncharacterized protein n=1 Tax=Arcella intermedia TaxID=1963864 RepID=A0A6B2L2Y8_9EUKA
MVDIINFPLDQLKFVLCLILSYPLGYLYWVLKSPSTKHLYTLSIGLFMILFCYGLVGLLHFFVPTLIMYGIFMFAPPQYLPKIAFLFMFAYLAALHIYRMVTDYMGYKLDATSLIMVIVIKISMFACNYYDGKRKDKEADLITPSNLKYAVTELPSLIQYYSYLCYFPTFLSGPAFHYSEFNNWINNKHFVHPVHNPEGKSPSFPFLQTLQCFGISFVLAGIFVTVTGKYPVDVFFVEGGVDHMSFFGRFMYLHVAVMGVRCRYYFIWKLAEGAGIMSGLGFGGYDEAGNPLWDGLSNIEVLKIEICASLRDVTTYWNIKTGEWLKNYVYFRQTRNPNKDRVPGYALYLTNTASAFWHGFYPGYYFSFLYAAFTTDIARQIRSIFRPLVTEGTGKNEKIIYPKYYIYDVLGRIIALTTFNYGFLSFVALSIPQSYIAYQNLYFSGHILSLVVYAALYAYNATAKKPKKD